MLGAVALAWAAIALSSALFGAVMLGCRSTVFRHGIQVEVILAEIRQYETERVGSDWDQQSKRQY